MARGLRKFQDSDYKTILRWYLDHKIKCPEIDLLPETGVIIDELAAGFIYVVEKKMGWIDFYITNPRSELRARNKALDEITKALLIYAKLSHVKIVMSNSKIPVVISRAEKHGFTRSENVTMLYREV